MSRDFFDNNKDVDSKEQAAHRHSFIERMSAKLQVKEAALRGEF